MAKVRVNKNEQPLRSLEDLTESLPWSDYCDQEHFTRLCTVTPNHEQECLEITEVHDEDMMKQKGLVYAMVVDGRIFKIGQSINTLKSRLGSYNAGKMGNRFKGTCSTANFFILQSLLNLGKQVEIYAFFPPVKQWELFGKTGQEAFPSAKVAERILLARYEEKYGAKPIGCSQG